MEPLAATAGWDQAILTFRWGGLNEIIAPAQWGETGGGGVRPGGWWLARKGLLTNLCMLYIYICPSLFIYIYTSISISRSISIYMYNYIYIYWLGITRNPRTGNHALNQAGLNGMIIAGFEHCSIFLTVSCLRIGSTRETPLLQYL